MLRFRVRSHPYITEHQHRSQSVPPLPPFRMSTSTSHPSTSSPDIPFHGFVETTADALRLIQAARQGVIPRITRRLNEEERATIVRSGAVFVFSVEESGIRRWTEGLSWSASRIAGNFLVSPFPFSNIRGGLRVVTSGLPSCIEN